MIEVVVLNCVGHEDHHCDPVSSWVSLCCCSFLLKRECLALGIPEGCKDELLSLDQRGQLKQDRLDLLRTAAGLVLCPVNQRL